MCEVALLNEVYKKVIIKTNEGKVIHSGWFTTHDKDGNRLFTERSVVETALREHNLTEDNISNWHINQVKPDNGKIYISEHASKRLKQRNGWGKRTQLRMLPKIYDTGKRIDDIKGKYASWIRHKEDVKNEMDELVLFGDMLYVFNRKTLVTVLHTPQKGSFYMRSREEKIA